MKYKIGDKVKVIQMLPDAGNTGYERFTGIVGTVIQFRTKDIGVSFSEEYEGFTYDTYLDDNKKYIPYYRNFVQEELEFDKETNVLRILNAIDNATSSEPTL